MSTDSQLPGRAPGQQDRTGAVPDAAAGGGADLRSHIRGSRYGSLLVLLVTGVLVAAAATLVARPAGPVGSDISVGGRTDLVVGSPAPDFQARTVAGDQVSLSELRGDPVWLTFGASWCASCQAEAADIQAAFERFAPSGTKVVGVFLAEDAQTVRDYVDRVGLGYPVIADPDEVLADTYRVLGIPVHVFIDSSGVIRQVETGALSPTRMDQALSELA